MISVCTERDFLEEIGRLTETVKPDEVIVFVFSGSISWDVPRRNPVPCPEEVEIGGSRQSVLRCVRLIRSNSNPTLAGGKIFVFTTDSWSVEVEKMGCVLLKDPSLATMFDALRAAGIR